MENYFWYACYGSNINKNRFLAYIYGGKPDRSMKTEQGCKNKLLPLKDKPHRFSLPLYFAKTSETWNDGGIAFLGLKKFSDDYTLGRKYLVLQEQFTDIVRQENDDHAININFDKIIESGSEVVSDSIYGNILFLGYEDNYPVFTFTSNVTFNEKDVNKPDISYLKTIADGLTETYPDMSLSEITYYFISKKGIREYYTFEKLKSELLMNI